MGRVVDKLLNWYFSKNSLPYWCVLLADSAICYISGIIVFWFYYRGAVTLGNIGLLSKTIAIYMVFNLIGFSSSTCNAWPLHSFLAAPLPK